MADGFSDLKTLIVCKRGNSRNLNRCAVCGVENDGHTGHFANGFWFCETHKFLRLRVETAHEKYGF